MATLKVFPHISCRDLKGSECEDLIMMHDRLPTMPLRGVQSRKAGLDMGEVFKGKMNKSISFFKDFFHTRLSNRMPHYLLPHTLWARATLSEVEGEWAREYEHVFSRGEFNPNIPHRGGFWKILKSPPSGRRPLRSL